MQERAPSRFELRLEEQSQSALKNIFNESRRIHSTTGLPWHGHSARETTGGTTMRGRSRVGGGLSSPLRESGQALEQALPLPAPQGRPPWTDGQRCSEGFPRNCQ